MKNGKMVIAITQIPEGVGAEGGGGGGGGGGSNHSHHPPDCIMPQTRQEEKFTHNISFTSVLSALQLLCC